jgi:hypothetical protein
MFFTVDSAKQFLLSKLSAQAAYDGISLNDIERRMFLFSEASEKPDFEANEIFEKYDEKAYESKMTKLLRKAYGRGKRTVEGKQEWADALGALSKEDFYGLVMVDQAGIPRRQEAMGCELWRSALGSLPVAIVELVIIVLGFLIVFRPSLLSLYWPDWVRWLTYPLFVWLFWFVGRVWGKMQIAKAIKRSKLRER